MRTLEINKIDIWYVNPSEKVDVIDDDGYFTGETNIIFGEPKSTRLMLYPASGDIVERLFGTDTSIDMIATSTNLVLEEGTLLFLSEPIDNFEETYDYKLSKILKSLNNYQYGLKGRI